MEGSQQVALARYVIKNWKKIEDSALTQYCATEFLDGAKLRDKLLSLLDYWDFEGKVETYAYQQHVSYYIYEIGNSSQICSQANATDYASTNQWPAAFTNMTIDMFDGVYVGIGMKLPVDKLEKYNPLQIAIKSWRLVYLYYWVSFCTLIACSIVFLLLIRRHRVDAFDFVSIGARLLVLAVGGALIALIANENALYTFLSSPAVLPVCLVLIFLVLCFDKLSATFCNWHLLKSGQPYAKEYDEDHHGHGHEHEHVEHAQHASGHSHHDSMALDHRKSAAWSMHSDMQPLTATGTEYYGAEQQSYAMTPLMSPPSLTSPPPAGGHAPGGYMPISNTQNYGA